VSYLLAAATPFAAFALTLVVTVACLEAVTALDNWLMDRSKK